MGCPCRERFSLEIVKFISFPVVPAQKHKDRQYVYKSQGAAHLSGGYVSGKYIFQDWTKAMQACNRRRGRVLQYSNISLQKLLSNLKKTSKTQHSDPSLNINLIT